MYLLSFVSWSVRSLYEYINTPLDRLEERGVERGTARRFSLKGQKRAIVHQTNIGTLSKATWGEISERLSGAHMGLFRAHIYHLELN